MSTIVLFHGTSSKFLKQIMRSGICPRGLTGKSTYEEKLISDPERVYFSNVYALGFAAIAVQKHGGNIMVASAKLEIAQLEPDTDFTGDGSHQSKYHDAMQCLEGTGCVCIKKQQVEAQRIYVFGKKDSEEIMSINHRISTGFRHHAFKEQAENVLNYYLMCCPKKYSFNDGEWISNQTGMSV